MEESFVQNNNIEESLVKQKVFKNVDDVLDHIGSYGCFQKLLNVVLSIMMMPMAIPILIMYFAALDPPWKCVANSTVCNFTRVMGNDDNERCFMSRNEWEYTEPREYSIITQFDIYCDKKWIIHLTTSVLFVGWGMGAVFSGWVADNYGRRLTMFPSILIITVVSTLSAFSPDIIIFTICRFIIGVFIPGAFYQLFIFMAEFVTSNRRPFSVNIVKCFFPLALCVLGLKAYLIREWKILIVMSSAPYILTFGFIWFVPESIRWLHIHGKNEELMKTFKRVASWNKTVIEPGFSLSLPATQLTNRKSTPLDLFRPAKMAIKTVIKGYAWMVVTMVFYGLTFAATDLGGSIYLNFVLINISDIVGFLASTYPCDHLGRRKTVCGSMAIGSLFSVAIAFIPAVGSIRIARVTCGVLGKMFIAVSFSSILIWSLELYPTNIRAQAVGFFQFTGRIGGASAPWIAKSLKPFYHGAPFLVMGGSVFIAACLLFTLPETKGMTTLEVKQDEVADTEVNEENELLTPSHENT